MTAKACRLTTAESDGTKALLKSKARETGRIANVSNALRPRRPRAQGGWIERARRQLEFPR